LGGGGRYDYIITNFIDNGQQYPAVGISFGLEPISAVLSAHTDGSTAIETMTDILVIPLNTYRQANEFTEALRRENIKVMLWTANEKVGKALEYANSTAVKFVAVVGENEIKTNSVQIKNMKDGGQTEFMLTEAGAIARHIKKNVNG
jgi:histidyl-tRNA synthetase